MLVNINLLPEKEKRIRNKLVWILLLSVVAVLICIFMITFYQQKTGELNQLSQEIQTAKKQQITLNKKLNGVAFNSDLSVQEQVKLLKQNTFSSVNLYTKLTDILPKNGRFITYTQDQSAVALLIQFSDLKDSANYLHSLNKMNTFKRAIILSINMDDTKTGSPTYLAEYSLTLDLQALTGKKVDES